MIKTETKTETRYKGTPNPFLCKSGYYVTELNMGYVEGDGYELISTTDLAGPFKSLIRAREVFKEKVIKDPYLNDINEQKTTKTNRRHLQNEWSRYPVSCRCG